MSRQLRRHPVAAKPSKQRPVRPALRATRAASTGREAGGRNLAQTLRPAWIEDVFSELRKVQWPAFPDAWNLTLVVIVVCVAFGISLGILDYVFQWLIQHTVVR